MHACDQNEEKFQACMCDAVGGSFIVQLGDCLTTFTVSMLYLLMRSFSGLSLVKPFTSCACRQLQIPGVLWAAGG